ncbi:MAG: hypothetical protein ACLGHT_02490 [Acidimicrobiia bacterium]
MATAMNITVGPWARDTPERLAGDILAEAHALRARMLAETEALCEEWLAEADAEAQAILDRADARAAAIVAAATATASSGSAQDPAARQGLLSRLRVRLRL